MPKQHTKIILNFNRGCDRRCHHNFSQCACKYDRRFWWLHGCGHAAYSAGMLCPVQHNLWTRPASFQNHNLWENCTARGNTWQLLWLTWCENPLITTLLRANSAMSALASFHTCAAILYSSMSGSCLTTYANTHGAHVWTFICVKWLNHSSTAEASLWLWTQPSSSSIINTQQTTW